MKPARPVSQLGDIIDHHHSSANPWDGDYKIPWDEPNFSRRMLDMHLAQDHDWASRRLDKIDAHVQWMHNVVLAKKPARILDLGCGPGLYCHRLSARHHSCCGIDFSPASIAYAREHVKHPDRCEFRLGDLRKMAFGTGFDLAVMIFGEFNAFSRGEVERILHQARVSLHSGGQLLVEAHTPQQMERIGKAEASWYETRSGLFSEKPHLCLTENHWLADQRVAVTEFFVIDAETATVNYYRNTLQGYSHDGYRALLEAAGFSAVRLLPAWGAAKIEPDHHFLLLLARE